ncbi:envelope biogenesis factor ElyC [Halomonas maura]|uniref:envelope biogenesis factor ElyC n=1 Tax=Halomonas maura TaxID=117606 RepID=UPI0025B4A561|nr:envelope biogenesis factor ElyC [Halomonas maura]MDN3555253.1 envelope biogenesis factor ElyC [Halomonas maura]
MYDLLKTLAGELLLPLPVALGLGGLGLLLAWWGRRRSGASLAVAGLALLVLSSWAPVADRLLAPLEARYPALETLPEDEALAGVVVLGGGWAWQAPWTVTGQLTESSAIRLMEGVRLWRQQPSLPLVVSGGSFSPEAQPVARGYARAARELGVAPDRLRVLDFPADTGREARAVREALGQGARTVLVTSASHMPRAMQHFRRAGLEPLAAPTHYLAERSRTDSLEYWVPSATQLHKTERAIHERLGQLAVALEH